MAEASDFGEIFKKLTSGQRDLLLDMAEYMSKKIQEYTNSESDILTPDFTANFSNRLLIHHATNEEKFKKKSFEFAFSAASKSAGRSARIVADPTNPGADVIVDGVNFSLKTEAASSIRADKITISKLMEARWIRDCKSKKDFARFTKERIVTHLEQYQRIICLRAFDVPDECIKYDLVEIPRDLLLQIRNLKGKDFRAKTEGGGSGADVYVAGEKAFYIRMDGSVEKVTISGLLTKLCTLHGSWTVPTIDARIAPEA